MGGACPGDYGNRILFLHKRLFPSFIIIGIFPVCKQSFRAAAWVQEHGDDRKRFVRFRKTGQEQPSSHPEHQS